MLDRCAPHPSLCYTQHGIDSLVTIGRAVCQHDLPQRFLLFQVQPLISRFILPWFGGGPAVWTTCLLFFQTVLFAGYAYAHASEHYLRPRARTVVHLTLIVAALLTLPITPSDGGSRRIAVIPPAASWRTARFASASPISSSRRPGRWSRPGSARVPGRSPTGFTRCRISVRSWRVQLSVRGRAGLGRPAQSLCWTAGFVLFAILRHRLLENGKAAPREAAADVATEREAQGLNRWATTAPPGCAGCCGWLCRPSPRSCCWPRPITSARTCPRSHFCGSCH